MILMKECFLTTAAMKLVKNIFTVIIVTVVDQLNLLQTSGDEFETTSNVVDSEF